MKQIRFKVRHSYYTKINYAIKEFYIQRFRASPITIRLVGETTSDEKLFFKSWEGTGGVKIRNGIWLGKQFDGTKNKN